MRPLLLSVSLLAVLLATGCGSSGSDSGSATRPASQAAPGTDRTVTGALPPGRLGAVGEEKVEVCDSSFHFSTQYDQVEYLQVSEYSCAFAKELAMGQSNGERLPEGWSCTTWIQDGHTRNDASVSCSERYAPHGSVGYTVKWL